MSMIYECPNCHAPQAAGRTACQNCGAEFDGAVPEDALVPDDALGDHISEDAAVAAESPEAEPDTVLAAESMTESDAEESVAEEPLLAEETEAEETEAGETEAAVPPVVQTVAAPDPSLSGISDSVSGSAEAEPPRLQTVQPAFETQAAAPSYQAPPPIYQSPAAFSSPAFQPPVSAGAYPTHAPGVSRALWIALPLILVFVIGVVYLVSSLNSGSGSIPPPLITPAPIASTPASTPVGSPVIMPGSASASSDSSAGKQIVGRWQTKANDFYVFSDNKTGSRGSNEGKTAEELFVWVMADSQIILYLGNGEKQEKLAYSPGPDENTIFLRTESGRYERLTRSKTGG